MKFMKELLVCDTTVFSVVTQRSLVERSVPNDFQIETNERWIITLRVLQWFHGPLFLSLPSATSGQDKLAG